MAETHSARDRRVTLGNVRRRRRVLLFALIAAAQVASGWATDSEVAYGAPAGFAHSGAIDRHASRADLVVVVEASAVRSDVRLERRDFEGAASVVAHLTTAPGTTNARRYTVLRTAALVTTRILLAGDIAGRAPPARR